MTEPDWAALEAAWRPARDAGVLGSASREELVDHAAGYLPAACRVQAEFLGLDLGSGAGVPGILLALARPRSRWVLVDANARRCGFARDAVRALGLDSRVEVRHARAEELAVSEEFRACVDLVVARSFGPPAEVAECGLPLLVPGTGRLVVSVTPETEAVWRAAASDEVAFLLDDVRVTADGRYLAAHVAHPLPARYPRRPAARRRSPLF